MKEKQFNIFRVVKYILFFVCISSFSQENEKTAFLFFKDVLFKEEFKNESIRIKFSGKTTGYKSFSLFFNCLKMEEYDTISEDNLNIENEEIKWISQKIKLTNKVKKDKVTRYELLIFNEFNFDDKSIVYMRLDNKSNMCMGYFLFNSEGNIIDWCFERLFI
ncbi:hypothetical protein [Aureivirga sp. CE67]|uniref:hypothetical protein n=1 Tax=Aureivirga sp. CE67 TaxID=1788983 RepID=UPI0018CB2106|nr:hypothetical protein [Aureivirga sp. CE67]